MVTKLRARKRKGLSVGDCTFGFLDDLVLTHYLLLCLHVGSGEMQLLATAYSDTLADLIDAYLSQADSIPAFLASVSMDLFNKQTLALT